MPRKQTEPAPTPIQQMTGHQNAEEMAESLPESSLASNNETTDTRPRGPNGRLLRADGQERGPRQRKASGSNPQPGQPSLMDDPQYKEAIQGMNFFGAGRIIKRGFGTAAEVMGQADIALSAEEQKHVDNYFYAVSKHVQFDPMTTIIGRVLLLILLIGELIGVRLLKRTNLGRWLENLKRKHESEEEDGPETTERTDPDPVQ